MLTALTIRNFALIDHLELHFSKGFTVFTGETGSGKSIILGALHLIMGERADYDVIRDNSSKSVVEATFRIEKNDFSFFFDENNIDFFEETIIRREIYPSGKSRAFVNDTPVQLNILQKLSSRLVKIHSQYQTYSLKSKRFQLQLIDDLSGIELHAYQQEFHKWKHLQQKVHIVKEQLSEAEKQMDYIQFQIEELEQLQLDKYNYSELESQLRLLENATEIIRLFNVTNLCLSSENGIIYQLNNLSSQLLKSNQLHPELKNLSERLHSIIMELKDMDETAVNTAENLEIPLDEKEVLMAKTDAFNRMLQKHRCDNQADLQSLLVDFQNKNTSTEETKEDYHRLQKQLKEQVIKVKEMAIEIHQERQLHTGGIIQQIVMQLKELKLPDAQLSIQVQPLEELNEYGASDVEIYFTSNKGSELKPITKAASGGELSRLMLVLEKLLSEKKELPTLLLDEIDTGVSGEVALKMGNILKEMGENMQLFTITHLPQVAAKGQHHLKVYKEELSGRTITSVRPLSTEERFVEIASLMSGEEINEAAIENAKILMNQQ